MSKLLNLCPKWISLLLEDDGGEYKIFASYPQYIMKNDIPEDLSGGFTVWEPVYSGSMSDCIIEMREIQSTANNPNMESSLEDQKLILYKYTTKENMRLRNWHVTAVYTIAPNFPKINASPSSGIMGRGTPGEPQEYGQIEPEEYNQ